MASLSQTLPRVLDSVFAAVIIVFFDEEFVPFKAAARQGL